MLELITQKVSQTGQDLNKSCPVCDTFHVIPKKFNISLQSQGNFKGMCDMYKIHTLKRILTKFEVRMVTLNIANNLLKRACK